MLRSHKDKKWIIFILVILGCLAVVGTVQADWQQRTKLTASDAEDLNNFGKSVAISGDTAIVGAVFDDDNGFDSGAAYVFHWDGTNWVEQAKLTASDGATVDNFGWSVAISDDTVVVGAPYDDDNGNDCGSAYVFVWNGSSWAEQDKLTASDGATLDNFGKSVAISSDTVIVGTPYDDDYGTDSGAAYVFNRQGDTWSEQAKLTAGAAGDNFGNAVAISGNTVIAGAIYDDANGTDSGSAYVFIYHGTSWLQSDKLKASAAADLDNFGHSIAIDGNTIVVGAIYDDDDNGYDCGVAYVFVPEVGGGIGSTNWKQQAKLLADDGYSEDLFGCSVSISDKTIIVGAYGDDDNGLDSGSAYVFGWDGTNWGQQTKLTASDGAAVDNFGWSVSISNDTAIIGAIYDDDGGNDKGSAYIFHACPGADLDDDCLVNFTDHAVLANQWQSEAQWPEKQKLTASDGAANDHFGRAVAISGDNAIVGAQDANGVVQDCGSAYIFYFNGTNWGNQAKLSAPDGAADDYFGSTVSISGDTAVVGAPGDDDNGDNSGSAYIFQWNGTNWIQQAKLTASDGFNTDFFGCSVSISGDTVIVGALGWGNNKGRAYIFKGRGMGWIEQAQLNASDGAELDEFGHSVCISGDTAIVGAPEDESAAGSAYVFHRQGTTWNQQAKLTASDGASLKRFGISVYIRGESAIVGEGNSLGTSAAYIFQREGANWSEQAKLLPPDGASVSFPREWVGINGDIAVLGAGYNDDHGTNSGEAYIFYLQGTNWTKKAELTASDGAAFDLFGLSAYISNDTAIIGAPYDDNDNGDDSGSAYIYKLDSPVSDLNVDWLVSLKDLAIVADQWLQCGQ